MSVFPELINSRKPIQEVISRWSDTIQGKLKFWILIRGSGFYQVIDVTDELSQNIEFLVAIRLFCVVLAMVGFLSSFATNLHT